MCQASDTLLAHDFDHCMRMRFGSGKTYGYRPRIYLQLGILIT